MDGTRNDLRKNNVGRLPETEKRGSDRSFLSGVGVLTVATLLSKVIGLFYRIPLLSIVGIGGMAYFHAANHIYVTLYVIASAGLPLALSILVAERAGKGDTDGAEQIYRTARRIFLAFGALGTLLLLFGAPWIARRIGLEDAALSLRVIAPTLLLSCLSAAVRGYFQGFRSMTPTAVSEVIESLGKLIFGLLLARYAVLQGYDKSVTAAFASAGIVIGVLLSFLYLSVRRLRFSAANSSIWELRADRASLRLILRIAAPVTCSSLVLSVASVVDTVLISRRLCDAGFTVQTAEMMYSSYGNLALPLFNLPASLITPVSLALVPLLSSAFRSGRREEERTVISSAIRLSALLAIPASMGLSIFAEPILRLLYPGESDAVAIAAPLLSVLALSVLFSCFMTVTNAILSTYGQSGRALLSMSLGAAVKILSEYLLVGMPGANIYGAPISTFLCNLCVTSVNLYLVCRYSAGGAELSTMLARPFLASLLPMLSAGGVYAVLVSASGFAPWKALASLLVAVLLYVPCAVKSGALQYEDLDAIPLVSRLLRKKKSLPNEDRRTAVHLP